MHTAGMAGALRALLSEAERAVVFTGAGISTESGIPDFRSPGGIWSKTTPIYFQEFMESEDARREYWRRKLAMDKDVAAAQPNRGHRAVAELVRNGSASSVVTQNIDGLHQASGIVADRIIELHGNGTYATCLTCAKHHALAPVFAMLESSDTLPTCSDCGGIIKPATISFGQPMPEAAMRRAQTECERCDLLLVIGSSLVVYPAAGFPATAKGAGARLVILNRDPTEQDALADLVIHDEIGPTLGAAVGVD